MRSPPLPSEAKKILVVDDNELVLNMLSDVLTDFPIITTTSPLEALALLKSNQNDIGLVISDLEMPEMSGLELYRHLNGMQHTFPFFITTGSIDPRLEKEAKELGVDLFLRKPVDQRVLLENVRKALDLV